MMFKESRPGSGEHWAEKIACEICRNLGIPHAEYDFATYRGRCGVVTPSFVPASGRLVLANELLGKFVPRYETERKFKHSQHTIGRALTLVKISGIMPPQLQVVHASISTASDYFIGYLVLDALIANQDRHHENWGVILGPNGDVSLAPTFDHGSSLARNETDENRVARLDTKDRNRTIQSLDPVSIPFG